MKILNSFKILFAVFFLVFIVTNAIPALASPIPCGMPEDQDPYSAPCPEYYKNQYGLRMPDSAWELFQYRLSDALVTLAEIPLLLLLFPLVGIIAAFFALRKKYTGKNHPYALYVLLLAPTPIGFWGGKDLAGPWAILIPLVFIAYIFWRAIFRASLKLWHRILVIIMSLLYIVTWGGLLLFL